MLHRGDQDVEGLGEEGDGRAEFDIHDREQGASEIRTRQGGEARVISIAGQLATTLFKEQT
jgi:hypothetical protein